MEKFEYLNSFTVQSFQRPVKGVTCLNNNKSLFVLLDDGSCCVFSLETMRVSFQQKLDQMQEGIQCLAVQVRNSKSGQEKELVISQHKNGNVFVLLIEESKIIVLNKLQTNQIGFLEARINFEKFSKNWVEETIPQNGQEESTIQLQKNLKQQENKKYLSEGLSVLSEECLLTTVERSKSQMSILSLITGRKKTLVKLYEKGVIDSISSFKIIQIQDGTKTINLLILAHEGLALSILQLGSDENGNNVFDKIEEDDSQTNNKSNKDSTTGEEEEEDDFQWKPEEQPKWVLKKTSIIQTKEEMPYIFDFTVQIDSNQVISFFIGTSLQSIHVLKFDLKERKICLQSDILLKQITENFGVAKILIDNRHIYTATLDRQTKILNQKKGSELASFAMHNGPVNALILTKEEIEGESKSKLLISGSEDCKLIIIDLNRLRKKKN